MFLVAALSLAGIPPLSGFIVEVRARSMPASRRTTTWSIGVSLFVSLLTLFAMIRIWTGAFWSPPEDETLTRRHAPVKRSGGPLLMVAPTAALVVCSLAIAAAAGPIYSFSERTAHDLLDRQSYIDEVLVAVRTVARVAILVALWLLAWGEVSLANVLSGIVVAGVVLVAFPPSRRSKRQRPRAPGRHGSAARVRPRPARALERRS